MNETNFPQFGYYWRNEHVYGEVEAFDIGAIEDWFKRCIADFPEHHYMGWGIGGEEEYGEDILQTEEVEAWFEKWFSQFEVKDE